MNISMGRQIAYRRKALRMTQDQLADRLGVTKQAVSKWENEMCFPDILILPELAEIFDCSTDALFGLEEESDSDDSDHTLSHQREEHSITIDIEWGRTNWNKCKLATSIWMICIGICTVTQFLGKETWAQFSYWNCAWSSALFVWGILGIYPRVSLFRIVCAVVGCYWLLESTLALSTQFHIKYQIPISFLLLGFSLLAERFPMKKGSKENTNPDSMITE